MVFPDALKVVNAPEDAVVDPIATPSISPPSISTVDKVEVPVAVKSVVVIPPLAVNAPVKVVSTVILVEATIVSNSSSSVYSIRTLISLSSSL